MQPTTPYYFKKSNIDFAQIKKNQIYTLHTITLNRQYTLHLIGRAETLNTKLGYLLHRDLTRRRHRRCDTRGQTQKPPTRDRGRNTNTHRSRVTLELNKKQYKNKHTHTLGTHKHTNINITGQYNPYYPPTGRWG